MTKTIIFDWNGTIFDDLEVVFGSVRRIFETFGISPPTLDQYRNEITADFMKFYWKYGIPHSASGTQLNNIRKQFFEEHWNDGQLREGTKKVLLFCQENNITTAIASAEIELVLKKRLVDHGIENFFHHVRGNCFDKKNALLEIAEHLKIRATDTLYIGDTEEDVLAAREAHMISVGFVFGYNTSYRILAAKPTYIVGSMGDFVDLLRSEIL